MKHDLIIISDRNTISSRKNKRLRLLDRVVLKARQEIMAQEDAAIFAILDALDSER